MEFVDYKCLESLLIEGEEIATESIGEKLAGPAIIGMLLAAIGFGIDNYKKAKEEKKRQKANKAYAEKAKSEKDEVINKLYEQYNLNDPTARKKFKEDLTKDIDKKIKKMVNSANHNKQLFESLKSKVLDFYNGDEKLSNDILKELKPGYFTANYTGDGRNNWWEIVFDQEVASASGICWDIAEALNSVPDPRYKFVSFHAGDGDEGCVYIEWYL